jgi:Chitin binding Peritrophin-A domain
MVQSFLKVNRKMFFAFVFLITLATSKATFCASPNEETLYIYTSPRNCTNFIACIDNEEYEFECLNAPVFYPQITEPLCVQACASVATTKKASSSKSSSDLPLDPLLFPDSPARTIVCPPTGETKAVVAQSCSKYISCKNGVGTKEVCPDGQEFSPNNFECVLKTNSDCQKQKAKGTHHIKCRYDKGSDPIYFASEKCPEFKKCANQLAWDVKCARYCHWNNELKTCAWADSFNCHQTNQ